MFPAAVLIIAAGAFLATSSAQASPVPATASSHVSEPGDTSTTLLPASTPGAWVLKNVHTSQCIDDSFASHLRDFPCNGLDYQAWWMTSNSDGSWTFQNVHTSLCIDDSFASHLRDFPCNGLDYQAWWRTTPSFGIGVFQSEHTSLCIDDSSAFHLRDHTCNGQDYQEFYVFPSR
jgi:hypothetical protein